MGAGTSEARRAEARGLQGQEREWDSWGPHQLGGLGERCKLPQWGPGRSPGRHSVFLHLIDARLLFLAFQKLLAMPEPLTISEHVSA